MNRKYLLASAALFGAMFAGSTRQAPTASVEVSTKAAPAPLAVGNYQLDSRKPAPAKPTSQPVAQRRVAVGYQPYAHSAVRFIEKPHLRKVKYGKRRWVLV